MITGFVLRRPWVAVICFLPFLAAAAEPLIFDSCLDAQGRTVTAVADSEQAMLVRSDSQQGQPLIRYNPDVLPRLGSPSRLFFYAHQCARLGLDVYKRQISASCRFPERSSKPTAPSRPTNSNS